MPKVGLGRGNVVNLFFFFAFSFFSKLFYIKKRGTTKAFVEVLSFLFLSFLLSLSLSLSLSKSWLLAIPFRSFLSLLHNGFEVVRFKTFFFSCINPFFFTKKKVSAIWLPLILYQRNSVYLFFFFQFRIYMISVDPDF